MVAAAVAVGVGAIVFVVVAAVAVTVAVVVVAIVVLVAADVLLLLLLLSLSLLLSLLSLLLSLLLHNLMQRLIAIRITKREAVIKSRKSSPPTEAGQLMLTESHPAVVEHVQHYTNKITKDQVSKRCTHAHIPVVYPRET